MRSRHLVRTVATAVTLCAVALAAGCGGGDDDAVEPTPSATETTADDGTTLPGTELAFGDLATVDYDAGKAGTTQLRLTVNAVKQGKLSDLAQFTLPDSAQDASVYYVSAAVANLGRADIGGSRITLYGKVSDTLVVQPVTFGSTFARCDYTPLPKKFGKGAKARLCMVMLAPKHGKVGAVEWRGADDAAPISWEQP